jgi:hypothetical protein
MSSIPDLRRSKSCNDDFCISGGAPFDAMWMLAASSDFEDRALGMVVLEGVVETGVLLWLLLLLFVVDAEGVAALVFSELAHRSTISAP